MKSFDEWYSSHETEDFPSLCQVFEAGQQSKQAEVDGQFIANCKQTDHIHKLQREKDELRKRIDEALKFASDAHSDLNIGMLKMAEILKGDQS